MPKGQYQRKPRGGASAPPFSIPQTGVEPVSTDALNAPAPTEKTVAMELKRHYVPHKLVSIVGYQKPARIVKNAAGEKVEVEPASFVDGEMFPPIFPGVGFEGKIWAGTVIEVPEPEAKTMRANGIAEAYL